MREFQELNISGEVSTLDFLLLTRVLADSPPTLLRHINSITVTAAGLCGLDSLGRGVRDTYHINELVSLLGSNAEVIGAGLHSLDLSSNFINDDAVASLAPGLACCPSLTHLDLSFNQISE